MLGIDGDVIIQGLRTCVIVQTFPLLYWHALHGTKEKPSYSSHVHCFKVGGSP